MKRVLTITMMLLVMLIVCGCSPYVDSESNSLDKDALALDALDEAFPEIAENITEEQLFELIQDERCGKILKDYVAEEMYLEDAAAEEYCTIKDARDLMIYAFGDEGDGWADELTPITGAEIIEKCK